MNAVKTVTVYDIEFDVDVDSYEGRPGTYWEPPEYPETRVNTICLKGTDIDLIEVLSNKVIEKIEELV